jgi:hypothetical protein
MVIVTITRCDLRDEFAMAAADEAFALSPISARAALPSEADYDAIREAFMETARGRWFLGEYGKRNRNADTSMVLDAVARIEATITAQKQAPSNELPDALVLIRGLLSDAKASAATTMSGSDAEEALAAVNKGTRIIREIAWTLREYGTDVRICDMLDAQVNAIEASHFKTIAVEKRDAVLATFDLLIRRVGELGGSGGAPSAPVSEATASPSVPDEAIAETAEAATPQAETAAEAVTATTDAVMPSETATTAHDTAADDTAEPSSSHADASLAATAAITRTEPLEAAIAATTDAETATLDLETAEDMAADEMAAEDLAAEDLAAEDLAVLDAIALEMAEPEMDGPDLAEPQQVVTPEIFAPAIVEPVAPESVLAEPDLLEPDLAEPDLAEPDLAEPDLAEPDLAEPDLAEPATTEPEIVEATTTAPPLVELAPEIAIAPEPQPEPEAPPQPSLGASLIASGILSSRSSGHDALAPLRRMSQAERIAFFS